MNAATRIVAQAVVCSGAKRNGFATTNGRVHTGNCSSTLYRSPAPEGSNAAKLETLRRCPLFSELPREDLPLITCLTTSKSLGKGAYLFYEGGPVYGFYIVQSGAIKLSPSFVDRRISKTSKLSLGCK